MHLPLTTGKINSIKGKHCYDPRVNKNKHIKTRVNKIYIISVLN